MDRVTGGELWSAPIDFHHWSSPVIADGVVYMADGKTGDGGASQGNTGTMTAFSLTADHPITALRAVGMAGLSMLILPGHIILGLPKASAAEASLLSLDGKSRMHRLLTGPSPFDIEVPKGLHGAMWLRVRQGQGESTRRIHLD